MIVQLLDSAWAGTRTEGAVSRAADIVPKMVLGRMDIEP